MSKFTDIVFDVQNISLNKMYTETNQQDRKERVLKMYKKKYWDQLFEETERIFRATVSRNYKKERKFFDQVRKIKETGIDFFEKLLDCDFPERYNTFLFAQIVMNKEAIYNCKTEFYENWNGSFCLSIDVPMIIVKENEERECCEYLNSIPTQLDCDQPNSFQLGFRGDSKNHTEEDFWKLYDVEKCFINFQYCDNDTPIEKMELLFLK